MAVEPMDRLRSKLRKGEFTTGSPFADTALRKGEQGVYMASGYTQEEIKKLPPARKKEICENAVGQMSDEGYFKQDPTMLSADERRDELWRLKCMGIHPDVIQKVLGITRQTYYLDLKRIDEKLKADIVALGPLGILARSYDFYDNLRDKALNVLSELPEDATTMEKLNTIRLAKDIEDSKHKLILGVGAIQRSKPRMHEELHDDTDDEIFSMDKAKKHLMSFLRKIEAEEEGSSTQGKVIEVGDYVEVKRDGSES